MIPAFMVWTDDGMDSTQTPDKRWQIRVLNGPSRGVSRVITGRLTIGRAATADIHLPSSGVSRQHAKIVLDEQGRHILVDLASANGTLVDGEPIEQHVLQPHTFFSVADIDLAYEEARELPMSISEQPRVDGRTLRGTEKMPRYEEANTRDYPAAQDAERDPSATRESTVDPEGRPMTFETPDGGLYEGNLIDDIVEYRSLRVQHLRGGFSDPAQRLVFERLRQRLQQPPSDDPRVSQRAFCRFGCWFPATVRLASGVVQSCRVRDFGVDGAQLVIEGHSLVRDIVVWLTIVVSDDCSTRTLVLGGRVAWVDDEFIGLAFAGAPKRMSVRYSGRPKLRQRVRLPQAPPPSSPPQS